MSEATSALTFQDLIVEVAYKLGMASYGTNGDEEPQVPTDAHDLAICKRVVNNAIRMFVNDGPQPNGWRWLRPVASVDVWASITTDSANAISSATYNSTEGKTLLIVPTAAFFATMELHDIVITTAGTFTITDYISSTQIKVSGDASAAATRTWSITADGNYTLPTDFGGQVDGKPTFASGTNRGTGLNWVDESIIRLRRSNVGEESGTPWQVAIRKMDPAVAGRRFELMADRTPGEDFVIEFPYTLHFDKLVNLDDVPPSPIGHDEAVKAACRAQAEKDVEDTLGMDWQYYAQKALPNSWRVDAKNAPRALGYAGNGTGSFRRDIQDYRNNSYQRPTVTVN